MSKYSFQGDISIVICGEAGQGIQTVESILINAVKFGGHHVCSTKEYMSRVRGGENSTEIRVSSNRVCAYVDRIDVLIAISKGAINHLKDRISENTLIIGDEETLKEVELEGVVKIPFLKTAREIGGPIYANVIAAGLISKLLNIDKEIFDKCITSMFERKGEKIVQGDLKAGREGYKIGDKFIESSKIKINIKKDPNVEGELLLDGSEAVGLGCIAANLRFMSSYPMTPASALQVFIAKYGEDFGMVFEQSEDEIAAINMGLGASYAGARSMVATSGSGYALMEEGVGLARINETPIVIYLGQRPGPAVGMPTRTSQEDLNLALYGYGETPKMILAPGKLEDAFYLTQRAFNMADKYQVPVFILSDQYFGDIFYNVPSINNKTVEIEDHIIKTDKNYKRYEFTSNGISPRGIPGFGKGLVVSDPHEHDEEGHITEDKIIRTKMVEKRLKKLESIQKDTIKPELVGSYDYKKLIVAWGSNYGNIVEAMKNLNNNDIAFLYFKQVYPLHQSTKNYLDTAEQTIIFENNAESQFSNLIKLQTDHKIDKKVLKYDGRPFSVEEITEKLKSFVSEDSL
jgi:2-oxoglutarate/2-oxoacid ferredoxin oxidoreductase subunit alpha